MRIIISSWASLKATRASAIRCPLNKNTLRRHKLPILLAAIAIIFLLVGLLIPNLNDAAKGFVGNLFAEAVGIFAGSAITIAVIDELLARRARRLNVERARKQTEGLLLDVAARALWASQNYEPGALENLSTDYSALEPWRTIINRLSCNSKWHSARLAANDPSPELGSPQGSGTSCPYRQSSRPTQMLRERRLLSARVPMILNGSQMNGYRN
jgi:hypothetical protein